MSILEILDELIIKIVKLVAADQCLFLGPLICSGKKLKKIFYLSEVLKNASIYSLCSDAEDIMIGGRYRNFFQRCLDAGNATAYYYEGLRLVVNEGDIDRAIDFISRNVPQHADATFTAGILSICQGNAFMYLQIFDEHHYKLNYEDARETGEELIRLLAGYSPRYRNTFGASFAFRDLRGLMVSECGMPCTIGYDPKINLCNDCYIYWCTEYVSLML